MYEFKAYGMTRTEAIFDIIKGLPELELSELLNQVHEHCHANSMGHLFDEMFDDSYSHMILHNQIEELKNQVIVAEGPCTCSAESKTGWTQVKCCNICGRPTEEFWTKKIQL